MEVFNGSLNGFGNASNGHAWFIRLFGNRRRIKCVFIARWSSKGLSRWWDFLDSSRLIDLKNHNIKFNSKTKNTAFKYFLFLFYRNNTQTQVLYLNCVLFLIDHTISITPHALKYNVNKHLGQMLIRWNPLFFFLFWEEGTFLLIRNICHKTLPKNDNSILITNIYIYIYIFQYYFLFYILKLISVFLK